MLGVGSGRRPLILGRPRNARGRRSFARLLRLQAPQFPNRRPLDRMVLVVELGNLSAAADEALCPRP